MTLLVDAYNVLHVTGVLPPELAGVDVRGLATLIAASRWRARRAILICDGVGPTGEAGEFHAEGHVEVRFAGRGADADSAIERVIRRSTAPKRLLVVSSDRRVQRAARRRRAEWMTSEGFLSRLAADASRQQRRGRSPATPPTPLPPERVESWLADFGLDEDHPLMRLRRAAGRARSAGGDGESSDGGGRGPGVPQPDSSDPPDDPLLREAMQEWRGRLSWDDLDMRRWLDEGHGPDSHKGGRR